MKNQIQKSPSEMLGAPWRRGEGDTLACLRRLYQQAGRRGEDISLTCSYNNGIESFSLNGKCCNAGAGAGAMQVLASQGNNQRGVAPSKPPPSSHQPNRKERRAADPVVIQKAAAHTAKQAAETTAERAAANAAEKAAAEKAAAEKAAAEKAAAEKAAAEKAAAEKAAAEKAAAGKAAAKKAAAEKAAVKKAAQEKEAAEKTAAEKTAAVAGAPDRMRGCGICQIALGSDQIVVEHYQTLHSTEYQAVLNKAILDRRAKQGRREGDAINSQL
jgi:flagellar biosynthesis GTPase FlhF